MKLRGPLIATCTTIVFLTGCSGSPTAQPTVTVTQPAATTPQAVAQAPAVETTVAAAALDITLPDVAGVNAAIAQQQLEKLGLKNVEFASANPKYSVVVLARNWTVTGMEPAAGTAVKASDTVILKVYKD